MRLTVIGLSLLMVAMVTADQKYMAVFTKELRIDMEFEVDMTLTEAPAAPVEVSVSIRKGEVMDSQLVWDDSKFTISLGTGETWQKGSIMVPPEIRAGEEYYVHLSFTGLDIKPVHEKVVSVRPSAPIVIVTDKPLYNPGQTVYFRVLNVDMKLKPKKNQQVTVEIKDGNKNSIMRELSEPHQEFGDYGQSLVDGSFELSDDPVLGMYTLSAKAKDSYTEATFEVKEYVLPKFQVILTLLDDYLLDQEKALLTVRIEAKYSYGKAVSGKAKLKVTDAYGVLDDKAIVWHQDNFNGVAAFSVNITRKVNIEPYPWRYNTRSTSLKISAELAENNTEKTEFANTTITLYPKAFAATVKKPMPTLFQDVKSYTFEVELTNPMGGVLGDWDREQPGSNGLAHYVLYYKAANDIDFLRTNVTSNPQSVTLDMKTDDDNLRGNGIVVYYEYTPGNGKKAIQSQHVEENIAKYYTWSSQTISAELVPSNNQNEKCFKITPFKSGDRAYYQLVNNYYPEKKQLYTNEDGHCFTPEQKHAPKTRIVVYKLVDYTIKDTSGTELLTAYVDVDSTWTPEQEVTLEVTSKMGEKVLKPGENATIAVQTKGQFAIVGVTGVDKSVSFMADANDVTVAQLLQLREAFRPYGRKKENKFQNGPMPEPMPFGRPVFRKKRCSACTTSDQYMDSKKLLEEAGLNILTDLQLKRHTEFETNNRFPEDDRVFFMAAAGGGGPNEKAEFDKGAEYPVNYMYNEYAMYDYMYNYDAMSRADGQEQEDSLDKSQTDESGDLDPKEEEEEQAVRDDFPETWVWDLVLTDSNGAAQITREVPDTITNWVVNAFGMNDEYGLAASEKKEITVFQPIFISMNLPYSVVRTENVELEILVFNYESSPLTVDVYLRQTVNYTIVDRMAIPRRLTIAPSSSGLTKWMVQFNTIGDIPLKADASEVGKQGNADSVERLLKVEAEGIEVRDDTNLKIAANGVTEQSFNMSEFFRKEGYVPGSLRMYLYVTGDMMGVFISTIVIKIKMPFGCGEQNIKSLTPSVFIARYLKKINRMDKKVEALVGKVCGAGYRKELNYLHQDGSYSAFGDRPNMCVCGTAGRKWGSTWLTAYVLKVFALMYIDGTTYVSPDTMKKSFDYIKNNVTFPDCDYQYVVEKGELIHTEMQGETSTRLGLVAFVLNAVMDYRDAALKAGMNESASEAEMFIKGASAWLKLQTAELIASKNPYQMAIVAYALARASKSSVDSTSVQLLAALESTLNGGPTMDDNVPPKGECMYKPSSGERKDCTRNPSVCNRNQECCKVACESIKMCSQKPYESSFRYHQKGTSSSMIETKGYALMAYLELYQNEADAAKKAEYKNKVDELKDWLLGQRKGNGFFSSTQDTVVALEALSRYAMAFPNANGAAFKVRAKADEKYVSDEVTVDDITYTVTAEEKLNVDQPTRDVSVSVSGTYGTAFINLVAVYNVAKNVSTPVFNNSVEIRKTKTELYLHYCFRKNPDYTGTIGTMVVANLKLPTCMQFDRFRLKDEREKNLAANKFEIEGDFLSMYHMKSDDEFSVLRCDDIYISEQCKVEKRQPSPGTIMDYYDQKNNLDFLYSFDEDQARVVTTPVTIGASNARVNMFLLIGAAILVLTRLIM